MPWRRPAPPAIVDAMLAQLTSAALRGVDAYLVRVEVNVSTGLPSFAVVGLPRGAVREGRERVVAALRNAGVEVPPRRVTVNLAPADVRKEGSAFDLPIAVGLVAGMGGLEPGRLDGTALVGELGLDGSLRPVRGAVAVAAACRDGGVGTLVLPRENAGEAAVVEGVEVLPAASVAEVLAHLDGGPRLGRATVDATGALADAPRGGPDLAEVRGQLRARRALEVAAAGGHNLLLVGPPGAGKTMLARRLPGILPPLTLEESLEVTGVHSVAGLLPPGEALVARRPFRAPHHTISDAGLAGGGTPPRPGEVSLAHGGVLFLDELPEFRRHVLEVLRQPMEDGSVTLARARSTLRFPARFVLVAAMNPCPCGHHGDGTDRCTCDPAHVRRYRARVSGPLLDRIDLRVSMGPVPADALSGGASGVSSSVVLARVVAARRRQERRLADVPGVHCNARLAPGATRRWCEPDAGGRRLLTDALERLDLSARGYHRVLRVARTVADLEGAGAVATRHVAEAIQYRLA